MSLHINNNCATKRRIGKELLLTIRAIMLEEHVDLVAGDFNGAAWRQSIGTDFPMPPGVTPLWGRGAVPGEWTDVCGFEEGDKTGRNTQGSLSMSGEFIHRHHEEPRLKLYDPDSEHSRSH